MPRTVTAHLKGQVECKQNRFAFRLKHTLAEQIHSNAPQSVIMSGCGNDADRLKQERYGQDQCFDYLMVNDGAKRVHQSRAE